MLLVPFLRIILLAFLIGIADAARSKEERSNAFIGYQENLGRCVDQLPDCTDRAVANGCLYYPFTVREFCPVSCNIGRCTNPGKKVREQPFLSSFFFCSCRSMPPLTVDTCVDTSQEHGLCMHPHVMKSATLPLIRP